jgi:outer membrane protein OmpA-like peptidoglycan-associated protein
MSKRDFSNLQKYITWDIRSKSSKYLNEFENNVTKSINDANSIILNSLLDNINDSKKIDLFYENVTKVTPASDDILLNLSNTLVPNEFLDKVSENFLELYFDKSKNTFSSNIATNDFIKVESANAILKMCSLLILCYVAKNKINKNDLVAHFQVKKIEPKVEKPKDALIENVEVDKNSETKLSKNSKTQVNSSTNTIENEKPKSSKKYIVVGLLVVALGIGGYVLSSKKNAETDVVAANPKIIDKETKPQNIDGELVTNLGDFLDLTLPSDEIITIPEKGVEKALLDLILDKSKSVDDSSYWLCLDRIHFSERQTNYNVDSDEQIKNLSLIMSSFPKSEISIGCYTDNLGNPESNKTLSLKRAESLKNGLIKFGIQEKRIKTEGFGQEYSTGDNSTEAGRKQNRRISIKLIAK